MYSSEHQRKSGNYLPTLRIFFPGGISNEYRLRNGAVEFRGDKGHWRVLDASDVELHYYLDTEVSRWFRRIVDSNPYLLND